MPSCNAPSLQSNHRPPLPAAPVNGGRRDARCHDPPAKTAPTSARARPRAGGGRASAARRARRNRSRPGFGGPGRARAAAPARPVTGEATAGPDGAQLRPRADWAVGETATAPPLALGRRAATSPEWRDAARTQPCQRPAQVRPDTHATPTPNPNTKPNDLLRCGPWMESAASGWKAYLYVRGAEPPPEAVMIHPPRAVVFALFQNTII